MTANKCVSTLNLRTDTNLNSPRTPVCEHNKAQIWTDLIVCTPVLEEEKNRKKWDVQQWPQVLLTQGPAKKGSRCPSHHHHRCSTLYCCLLSASYDGLKPRKLPKSFSCLPGNSLLPCAGLDLASRCPSTQKDQTKGAYLEEINAYFKLIFKAWIMSILECSRGKGGLYVRVFILCRYIQFSGVKKP